MALPPIQKAYSDAKVFKSMSLRFWSPVLNYHFPVSENWLVSPSQLVHRRDSEQAAPRIDLFIEYYDPNQHMKIGVMMQEARRESYSAKALEKQAFEYAEEVVVERMVHTLYVLTTIGTTFRTWYFCRGSNSLTALMSGERGKKEFYIDASTWEASDVFRTFIESIKTSQLQLSTPKQPSQPSQPADHKSIEVDLKWSKSKPGYVKFAYKHGSEQETTKIAPVVLFEADEKTGKYYFYSVDIGKLFVAKSLPAK